MFAGAQRAESASTGELGWRGEPKPSGSLSRPSRYRKPSAPRLQGTRLQFEVTPAELWKDWCSLQMPIADEVNAGQWACVHNWGIIGGTPCKQIDPMTHQEVPVDCARFRLCQPGGVCACNAAGCSAGMDGGVTSLKSFQWAPKGSRLLYVDAAGSHVVSVTGGVLGTPQDIDASASTWSPNGDEIAFGNMANVAYGE